jgi:hypothetical protein
MDMGVLLLILVAIAIIAVAAVAWMYLQQRRTRELREGFGPEYERAVGSYGSRSEAERELEARQKRVEALHIRPLSREQCERFAEEWRSSQARFVDDPGSAIGEADRLVGQVMQARGYPVGEFEQRAADISVDHPRVVANYRAAHAIAERHARGDATTEDLRQAMVKYRALFEELLETDTPSTAPAELRTEREVARR